ncbi:LysR family transcriptional regulator, partial [Neisseria sicca]|uniref:LysR family transcriptional regulator n=1 Tax=Neisseria sicca TaxID=490 RepID=UPI003C771AD0
MELNNLNDMTAFVASVKSGSFTAAAKQLGLTRSTIGKRIARLEARLNVRLLQRNTRNLAPTDEGRLFYERCTAVLEELENAEQCLAQRSIEPQGRLKISAPLVLGKTILPPLLADFLHRYPQTSIELSLTDDYADLISDGYDLALRNGNPPQCDSLIARTVGSQQMLTCAAPGYLVQHGTPQTPDDLAHHQCLHFLHG